MVMPPALPIRPFLHVVARLVPARNIAFRLAAGLSVAGFGLWAVLVPPVKPVGWEAPTANAGVATQPA
jgi:hypothetical protein